MDCPRLQPLHPKLVGSVQHIGTNTYDTRTQQQKKTDIPVMLNNFRTEHFYARHLLPEQPFTPDTFYTRKLLHKTSFTPSTFYRRNFAFHAPFTPNTLLTFHRTSGHPLQPTLDFESKASESRSACRQSPHVAPATTDGAHSAPAT